MADSKEIASLEDFRQTRREVADLNTEIEGFEDVSTRSPSPGFVYALAGARFCIEKWSNDRVYLLCESTEIEDDISGLAGLEVELYDYARRSVGGGL